jgi:hypothetical protein
MIDLKSLQTEIAHARRARVEAETAGLDLEHFIEEMRAGRTLQEIAEEIEVEEIEVGEQALREAA